MSVLDTASANEVMVLAAYKKHTGQVLYSKGNSKGNL